MNAEIVQIKLREAHSHVFELLGASHKPLRESRDRLSALAAELDAEDPKAVEALNCIFAASDALKSVEACIFAAECRINIARQTLVMSFPDMEW